MTLYHSPQPPYIRYRLFERDVSDWKPDDLARILEQDRENNFRIKCRRGGKVVLEYLTEVGCN